MKFRKIKLNNYDKFPIKSEEFLLFQLLDKIPSIKNHTNTIFEDSMSFYGEWETSLYFFDLSSQQIFHFEEIDNLNIRIFKEYNTDGFFKTYKFLSYNHKLLSPVYSFFYQDKKHEVTFYSFVFDTSNPSLNFEFFKNQNIFSPPKQTKTHTIKTQYIDLHEYNCQPFLFLNK